MHPENNERFKINLRFPKESHPLYCGTIPVLVNISHKTFSLSYLNIMCFDNNRDINLHPCKIMIWERMTSMNLMGIL